MTWLTESDVHNEAPGLRLTQLIAQQGIVRIPGATTPLPGYWQSGPGSSACMCQVQQCPAVWVCLILAS